MAKTFGLPMELISPKEACDLFPVMEKKGIVGAAFLPTDGQIDPSGVTYALAKGARDRGADDLYRHSSDRNHLEERGGP